MSSSIPDEVPEYATKAQLWRIMNYWKIEATHAQAVNSRLLEEIEVLNKKIAWLQKAERLIIWDGTEWKTRLIDPVK